MFSCFGVYVPGVSSRPWQHVTSLSHTDEPSRPGKPEIIDYDNTMVVLKWEPPEKDGGRPITHYVIEMKDKHSVEWKEVVTTKDHNPEAQVPGLKEGTVYSFRVKAANKAGVGEASEPTDNHLCKHKNSEFQAVGWLW